MKRLDTKVIEQVLVVVAVGLAVVTSPASARTFAEADVRLELIHLRSSEGSQMVRIDGAVVTAVFGDVFYIQEPGSWSGIRVEKPLPGLTPGAKTRIVGSIGTTDDGEWQISASTAEDIGSGVIEPCGMAGRAIGGTTPLTGSGQQGTQAYQWVKTGTQQWTRLLAPVPGLVNTGLLIKTWGRVTGRAGASFYLDDGSRCDDYLAPPQSGPAGVRVDLPEGISPPEDGQYVQVTGISSCYKAADGLRRRVLATNVIKL
jgi:hypothetical protein